MESKYTKELLAPLVADSKSWSDLIRKLSLKPAGGTHRMIKTHVLGHGLSVSHFSDSSWNKGLTKDIDSRVVHYGCFQPMPDSDVFKVDSLYTNVSGLRKKALRKGLTYECQICQIKEWRAKPITLHLDHVNGIHNDNRIENLRFLCPNCHQQTDTWGNTGR